MWAFDDNQNMMKPKEHTCAASLVHIKCGKSSFGSSGRRGAMILQNVKDIK